MPAGKLSAGTIFQKEGKHTVRGLNRKYVVKRFFSCLLTLFIALTINFILPRLMGGNPAEYIASQTAMNSPEYVEALTEQFGLNQNVFVQYGSYLKQLLHFNFGISYANYPTPVSTIILNALPWTLLIVLSSTIISFAIAWLIGTLCAMKKGSAFDKINVSVSFYIQSVPYYFVAMILLMVFAFSLKWFPLSHALSTRAAYAGAFAKFGDILYHAFLPVLSLVLVGLAGRMIMMRSNVLQVFSEDYIVLAQAKGLKRSKILSKYALRNALLPSFTGLMVSLGQAVGGALVTELIFSYPGVGLTIYNAIMSQDYPVIQGCFAIIAVCVVTLNFIADLLYPIIDPRVSMS